MERNNQPLVDLTSHSKQSKVMSSDTSRSPINNSSTTFDTPYQESHAKVALLNSKDAENKHKKLFKGVMAINTDKLSKTIQVSASSSYYSQNKKNKSFATIDKYNKTKATNNDL